jgi:hypothetical protein
MKKIVTFLLLSIFFLLPISFSFAQKTESTTVTIEEETIEQKEDMVSEDEGEKEEEKSLADTLEKKEIAEIQDQGYSFWTILLAILIPSIFIILGYLMLKFLQT